MRVVIIGMTQTSKGMRQQSLMHIKEREYEQQYIGYQEKQHTLNNRQRAVDGKLKHKGGVDNNKEREIKGVQSKMRFQEGHTKHE